MKTDNARTDKPKHNFQIVSPTPPFVVNCYKCGRTMSSGEVKFADLDGPAFSAYYCRMCKFELEINSEV